MTARRIGTRTRAPTPPPRPRLRLWLRILSVSRIVEAELRERLRGARHHAAALRRDGRAPPRPRRPEDERALLACSASPTATSPASSTASRPRASPSACPSRATAAPCWSGSPPQGAAAFAGLAARHEAWVNELLGVVTAAEADHLIEQLQAVRNRLAAPEDPSA